MKYKNFHYHKLKEQSKNHEKVKGINIRTVSLDLKFLIKIHLSQQDQQRHKIAADQQTIATAQIFLSLT